MAHVMKRHKNWGLSEATALGVSTVFSRIPNLKAGNAVQLEPHGEEFCGSKIEGSDVLLRGRRSGENVRTG
jgi:hypothetical protein